MKRVLFLALTLLAGHSAFGQAHSFRVGDRGPAGGIIFYDKGNDDNGWRYLECAPYDQSGGVKWFNGDYKEIPGASATSIGSGKGNTKQIVNTQGGGNYAASLCQEQNIGGYSDWFLPSSEELNLMYNVLHLYNLDFTSQFYWSSSMNNAMFAFYKDFTTSENTLPGYTNMAFAVRAIREF